MKRLGKFALCAACLVIPAASAWAAWPDDPNQNVPVDTLGGGDPVVVADGTGGMFVAWVGDRGATSMVVAQHFDSAAQPLWPANGLLVAPSAPPGQTQPQVLPDGNGGVFVAWVGHSAATWDDIYAQRIDGSGDRLWGSSGSSVRVAAGNQSYPVLSADGAGGVVVGWIGGGMFAQRLDAAGVAQWATNGVMLGATTSSLPRLISDGAGGAIAAWAASEDIVAQRVDATGAPAWGASGVAVCSAPGHQGDPALVSDGSGGAIVAWTDRRGGLNWADFDDVYAQRISASGATQWTSGGVGVCTSTGWQGETSMIADGVGGAILAWDDHRDDSTHVYAQRIDGSGVALWEAGGVGLFSAEGAQILPSLAPDGASGAFVAWMDHRSGEFQVQGQRLGADGEQAWGPGGLPLSTSAGRQQRPQLAWDDASAAVVVWTDFRDTLTSKVYAQGVQSTGLAEGPVARVGPVGASSVELALAGPNPSRCAGLSVRFTLRGSGSASLDVLDVSGRRVLTRALDSLGPGSHTLELLNGLPLAPGLYLVRLREGARVGSVRVARLD